MAHHVKIKTLPMLHKDGSESKTRKRYIVTDRSRGKKKIIAEVTSKKSAEQARDDYWAVLNAVREATK